MWALFQQRIFKQLEVKESSDTWLFLHLFLPEHAYYEALSKTKQDPTIVKMSLKLFIPFVSIQKYKGTSSLRSLTVFSIYDKLSCSFSLSQSFIPTVPCPLQKM